MKMDLIQMIATLEKAQKNQYATDIQDVINGLKEMQAEKDLAAAAKGWSLKKECLHVALTKLKGPSPYKIDAFVNPKFPGIAIHREDEADRDEYHPGKYWIVTHILSGLRIVPRGFSNMRKAAKCVNECCDGFNWNRPANDIMDDPAMKEVSSKVKDWKD